MQVEITEKQLMRLRRAADITEMQNLMARLVEAFSRMDVGRVYEDLFAVGDRRSALSWRSPAVTTARNMYRHF